MQKGGLHDIQLDDVSDFKLTDDAMSQMGLNESEKLGIYGIVAGVLHLGNICFEEDTESKGRRQIFFSLIHLHIYRRLQAQQSSSFLSSSDRTCLMWSETVGSV